MARIYCAGPLFNDKEKEEMQEIADILEINGYNVFLPHRDGFEFFSLFPTFSNLGVSENNARLILNKAIFSLDVYQVLNCQGLILNINGRVPDEGAMVEAGIAWSSGKKIVIYKNDARTLLNGNDNPLVLGLSKFKVINYIKDIPQAFSNLNVDDGKNKQTIETIVMNDFCLRGEKIASIARISKELDEIQICKKLLEILEESNVLC